MQRTTVMLPLKLKSRAQRRAKERKLSLSDLVQESLETALESAGAEQRASDPLFADEEIFIGEAPADLSRHHDRYLYEDHTIQ